MHALPTRFDDPPWSAPLDVEAHIADIPTDATMNGLFLSAVVDVAIERGAPRPTSARPSYISFRPYPLAEHARLLVEVARAVWPNQPVRIGLRRLGRGAPRTLVQSMIGRVVLGSVEGPLEILRAMARSYPLCTKPGTLEIVSLAPGRSVVRMRAVHHFLDCHHVGVFEGVLRYAEVEDARVRIHAYSQSDADLLCEWRGR